MTDWKSRYHTLQQVHEQVVRQRNKLENRVKYLESYARELEEKLELYPKRNENVARNQAQRRAAAAFAALAGEKSRGEMKSACTGF